MKKDPLVTSANIEAMAGSLRERGVPVQEIEVLARAVRLIREWGFTDRSQRPADRERFLMPMQAAVVSQRLLASSISDEVSPHARALAEELHVLEGLHAPTSERFEEVLDFLLGGQG